MIQDQQANRVQRSRDSGPYHCMECDAETTETKPFCPRHLEQMPYVASLLAELEREALLAPGHAA